MNYKMWYDEGQGVLYLKTLAMLMEEDVHEIMPKAAEIFEDKLERFIIGDLSDSSSGLLSQGARAAFKKNTGLFKVDKIALVGANSAVRMIARITLTIMGSSDKARFFVTNEEALCWLKGEK